MDRYPIERKLKDGSTMVIKEATKDDELKLLNFFKSIPKEHRQYLRTDVTTMENLRKRMNPGPTTWTWRLVVEQDNKIWADGTLYAPTSGWLRHTCEIRCIVHPDFQRKNAGSHLLWELFQKTLSEQYRIIYCEVVPEQKEAIKVLENLGFNLVLKRPKHMKDLTGEKHDFWIYVKDVKKMWDNLKDHFHQFDTQYGHGM
ncbi:MAG: GNAT family N-acetyltransferase [Planctomycetes bacterium]|nr:GNAT family N-acetyltransferase [Planctomycetota bacterium]